MSGFYGGAQIVGKGTLFSRDGKHVMTAGERGVYVYSAVTSRLVAEYKKDRIAGISALGEGCPQKIMVATSERLLVWDYLMQKVLKLTGIPSTCAAISAMVVSHLGDAVYVSCVVKARPEEEQVLRYALPQLELDRAFSFELQSPLHLCLSPSGSLLCLLLKSKPTRASIVTTTDPQNVQSFQFPEPVHCMAFDVKGEKLAVGCASGRMLIYRHVNAEHHRARKRAEQTVLHWHASPPTALRFSSDDQYLFSTGAEGVLVLWRLRDLDMKFVPRLGLNLLSMDFHPRKESLCLISLKENCFKIVDTSLYKVTQAVYGMAPAPNQGQEGRRPWYCVQPVTGYLVLPVGGCSLQFYDLMNDVQISRLQVIPRMAVSRTKHDKSVQTGCTEPFVQSFVFNAEGTMLATVTVRSQICKSDVKTDLRFFDAARPGDTFVMNTEIHNPHKGEISSLCCSPAEDIVVTSSPRGNFRAWSQQLADNATVWKCKAVGSFRGYPLGECCFSQDGSVLAVAYPSGVGLWDAVTLTVLGRVSMPCPLQTMDKLQLQFVAESDFLVACLPQISRIVVWDVQTLALQWTSELVGQCLAVDATSKKFAVALDSPTAKKSGDEDMASVAVYDPAESTPSALYLKLPYSVRFLHFAQPGTALFKSGRQMENGVKHTHAPLILLSSSHQYSIETETGSLSWKGVEVPADVQDGPSAFEAAFGAASRRDPEAMEIDGSVFREDAQLDLRQWSRIPSHALPGVSVLCSHLLDQIFDKSSRT